MKKNLRWFALGCLLLTGLALAQSSQAARNLENYVYYYFSYLRPIFDTYSNSLDEGRNQTVFFSVSSAREYTIVGGCDDDCSDLDFELRDQFGRYIADDSSYGEYPQITATLYPNTQYRLMVRMEECSAEPCGYAMNVYRYK
jgi:hypothetical protein